MVRGMTDFSFNNEFDVITIFCDSLNYLPDIEDVNKTFINVFNHLSENGVFIFDVHTIYKIVRCFIINVILMKMSQPF